MLKILKYLFLLVAVSCGGFVAKPPNTEGSLRRFTLVIDAGHGGKDPGARGKYVCEKDIVLKLALQLASKIKKDSPNIRVILTRASDEFIELNERSEIANRKKADLFVSLHCNAAPKSSVVHGTETFAMGLHKSNENLEVAKRENAVILQEENYQQTYKGYNPKSPLAHIMLSNFQNAYLTNSLGLADRIEKQFKKSGRSSRGVKQAGFIVLWKAAMPAVLVEAGFLSNRTEEEYLDSDKGQDEITDSILNAIKAYREEIESNEDQ